MARFISAISSTLAAAAQHEKHGARHGTIVAAMRAPI
jgi:hypothetical protein